MSNYTKPVEKKKRTGIPIFGLLLVVALAVFAYGLSGILVSTLENQSDSMKTRIDDLRTQFDDSVWYQNNENLHKNKGLEIIIAVILWFVLMGVAMLLVAATVGKDPEKEKLKDMPPSPANKEARIKQLQADLKDAKQRAKQQKKRR